MKENKISGFWVVIAIIGIIISLTGVGSVIGVPMLGMGIFRMARVSNNSSGFGCLTIVILLMVVLMFLGSLLTSIGIL